MICEAVRDDTQTRCDLDEGHDGPHSTDGTEWTLDVAWHREVEG